MNAIQEALKVAADSLIYDLNPTEVEISSQRYKASISYLNDLAMADFSDRQKSTVMLSATDFETEPSEGLEITEVESGRVHRITLVEFQSVAWACQCEFRHNARTGPFK